MIKSRTIQLIYQSIYIGIAIIAIFASLGLFDASFRWDFYIHFTNLSNYLCIALMICELRDTAKRSGDSLVTTFPLVKFIALLGILLTFIIYNFILAPRRDIKDSFVVASVTLHIILPLIFTFDYVLFYEHGKVKWYYPILSTIFPLVYAAFIYIHAAILNFDSSIFYPGRKDPFIYPYFFLNLDKYGVAGVAKYIVIILIVFVVFGYLIVLIDKLFSKMLYKKKLSIVGMNDKM